MAGPIKMIYLTRSLKQIALLLAMLQSAHTGFLDDVERPDIRALRTRLEEEKAHRLLLQNDLEVMMVKVARMENALAGQAIQGSGGCKLSAKPEVSFMARLPVQTSLDSLHTIVFTDVLHNIGSAYSPHTGIFKAPYNGTYVFSLTLLSPSKGKHVHAQVMQNNKEIGRVFTGDNFADWGHTGSVTSVTKLEESDEVFVREFKGLSGEIHGSNYCTFSGFLI